MWFSSWLHHGWKTEVLHQTVETATAADKCQKKLQLGQSGWETAQELLTSALAAVCKAGSGSRTLPLCCEVPDPPAEDVSSEPSPGRDTRAVPGLGGRWARHEQHQWQNHSDLHTLDLALSSRTHLRQCEDKEHLPFGFPITQIRTEGPALEHFHLPLML